MSVSSRSTPAEPFDESSTDGRAAAAVESREARPSRPAQFAMVLLGLVTVFYGLFVMSLRPAALATVTVFAGVAFVIGGITQLGQAGAVDRSWRWLAYLGGLIGIGAGVAAFVWPSITLIVLAIVTAWALVGSGAVRIVGAVIGRDRDLWWLGLLAGVVELLLGLWAIGSPGRELLLMVNLIGIYLVIVGVDTMVSALAGRSTR